MLGWSGIWRASFIYRRYTFWNLNTTWQFAIYGFCLQTQMTLLKYLKLKTCWMNLCLFPLKYTIQEPVHWLKSFPWIELLCYLFLGLHCWKSWWSEHKTFHLSSSGNVSAEVLPGTRLPAPHRPSVPVNPPAARYRISHINGKNLHCFRASLLHS